jgi:hypothetical protein
MIGLGVGINRQRFAQGSSFFADYAVRVAADGGVTEAGSCVNAVSGISLNSSLLLVPSGYKAGKVYSEVPTNGNGDLTFTRASSATRVNSAGLVEVVESGVPRLDYSQGSCPALLLEPQRTNFVTYSEELDNVAWVLTNASVTPNDAISPDGTLDADKFVESSDVSAQAHQIRSSVSSIVTNQVYTYSIFAKGSGRGIQLRAGRSDGSTFSTVNVDYDLTLGVVDSFSQTNAEYIGSSIEDYGDGWYRCILQMRFTDPANITMRMQVYLYNESTNGVFYIGDGTSGAYLWGAQIEAGSYVSSYIPTLGAAVTRVADFATTNNISTLFGSTEGSFFIDMTYDNGGASGSIPVFLRSSISSSYLYATYLQLQSGVIQLQVYNSGSGSAAITSSAIFTQGQRLKIAFGYKQNDFVLYVNGSLIGTDISGNISSSLAFIDLGTYNLSASTFQYNGKISEAVLFPTRLTNAELQALTTL